MANSLRCLALSLLVVFCFGDATAQIMEFRETGDRTFACMHSGLSSDLRDCTARSDWYAYAFVGAISAITSIANDEKEIQIVPEEVFHGAPANPLTVKTSQAACLPPLEVGDRWLFFLRQEKGKPIILDYYGNDSRPVDDAQEEIETLRRLKTIGDFGIVRGSLKRETDSSEWKAVPDAHIVATRTSDKAQFFTTTDADGKYEFDPLGPGKYKITADPIGGFRPDESELKVTRGSCWVLALSKSPHAEISGHVRYPDGTPAADAPVLIFNDDGSGYFTVKSNNDGVYRSDTMRPGKYAVGINLPDAPAWKYQACGGPDCETPPVFLYYPGMQDRSGALVIALAEDEKRDNVDFAIPRQ
jgi:hypothetical protein